MTQPVEVRVERITKWEGEGSTRAFCDVAIAEAFLIKGIRVVQSKEGELFVGMPREQGKDEKWYSSFLPLSKEAHKQFSEVVLAAYHAAE